MAKARKRRQKQSPGRQREAEGDSASSSSSGSSGDDGMSTEDSAPAGSPDLRDIMEGIEAIRESQVIGVKETRQIRRMLEEHKEEQMVEMKEIRRMLKEHKEMNSGIEKQLKKLNEIHIRLHRQLGEPNCSSGDISLAPRSKSNQMQQPRFHLRITSEVSKKVETGKHIRTNHGDLVEVVLYDGGNPVAPDHPLAFAGVMMVIIKGEFNKNNNLCNWSKEDFEKSIVRPRQGNSATGDRNHGKESIVRNCTFYLVGGNYRHSGVTIVNNSSNKSVRLGVVLLSHPQERVLEGLSNHFLVRDPPKKLNEQRQEQNGPSSNTQYSPTSTQIVGNGINQVLEQSSPPANIVNDTLGAYPQHPRQPINNQQPYLPADADGQSSQSANSLMIRDNLMDQPLPRQFEQALIGCGQERNGPIPNSGFAQNIRNGINPVQEQPPISAYNASNIAGQYPQHLQSWLSPGRHNQSAGDTHPALTSDCFVDQPSDVSISDYHIVRPVQLVCDWPDVEPRKRWNLLDQLMPLYNRQTKIHSDSLSIDLMGALDITTIPKQVMQAHRNRGVLIQPLEHVDEDDEPPIKRKVHKKYRLRFVNKVCKTYYIWEQIEAVDGNLLKVALYDENNMIVTSGPLSSVSVEVVVLHGDFNSVGRDDWTSEEFRDHLVHPQSVKDTPVLGGHLVLILVDGQSSISSAFFRKTSSYARTEKFRMGVMVTSTPDGRVQEGISEPFWVRNHQGIGTMLKRSGLELADDVCLLENINQNEDYNKCLVSHDIYMVRNLRKNLDMDEEKLCRIISNCEPEEIDDRARSCDQLIGVKFDCQYKKGAMDFTTNEMSLEVPRVQRSMPWIQRTMNMVVLLTVMLLGAIAFQVASNSAHSQDMMRLLALAVTMFLVGSMMLMLDLVISRRQLWWLWAAIALFSLGFLISDGINAHSLDMMRCIRTLRSVYMSVGTHGRLLVLAVTMLLAWF